MIETEPLPGHALNGWKLLKDIREPEPVVYRAFIVTEPGVDHRNIWVPLCGEDESTFFWDTEFPHEWEFGGYSLEHLEAEDGCVEVFGAEAEDLWASFVSYIETVDVDTTPSHKEVVGYLKDIEMI